MFYQLKRHPIPVQAFFRQSLVLTYALPQNVLLPLLPPGLELDIFKDFGFLAIAMVQTERLRPFFLPRGFGQDFFLTGYRIFTRFRISGGHTLRGLRILRSDTNRRLMIAFGNLLTHYAYRLASVTVSATEDQLEVETKTPEAEADLHVIAKTDRPAGELPIGSPFADFHQARLFAGPLPFTFDYEPQTHSIVIIEGVRKKWSPKPVHVEVLKNTFLEHGPFGDTHPLLANAFHIENVDYRWKRGVREKLPRD
jgi:hypothetical protein